MYRSGADSSRAAAKASPTAVRRRPPSGPPPPSYSSASRAASSRREHHAPSARVEAGELALAADHELRRGRAVGRDAVDVRPAAVVHREEDVVAGPDRLADRAVPAAVAVERLREQADRARGGVDHADLRVHRVVVHRRVALHSDQPPVGRPGQAAHGAAALRETPRLPAGGVHQVHVVGEVDVPVLVPGRDEGDGAAVGRPHRAGVFAVAARELHRRSRAVGLHREQVLPPVERPADGVVLVVKPRDAARLALLVVFLVVGRVAHARDEDDRGAVRRPLRLRHVLLEVGQLARFASLHRHDVELRHLALTVGGEDELRAVRRPPRVTVGLGPRREPPRLARAVGRGEPDGAAVLVGLAVDAVHDVGDRRTVRREPGVRDPGQFVDVLRDHAPHACSLLPASGLRPPCLARGRRHCIHSMP